MSRGRYVLRTGAYLLAFGLPVMGGCSPESSECYLEDAVNGQYDVFVKRSVVNGECKSQRIIVGNLDVDETGSLTGSEGYHISVVDYGCDGIDSRDSVRVISPLGDSSSERGPIEKLAEDPQAIDDAVEARFEK